MVCPFTWDKFSSVQFSYGTPLHSGWPFSSVFGMSLHSELPVASVHGTSLHSGWPSVWGDGFNPFFHLGWLSMLSRFCSSFLHLLWLMGVTCDSFVLETLVVPKKEQRKIEHLAQVGWWLIENKWLITNENMTNMTYQMSSSQIFQHTYMSLPSQGSVSFSSEIPSSGLNMSPVSGCLSSDGVLSHSCKLSYLGVFCALSENVNPPSQGSQSLPCDTTSSGPSISAFPACLNSNAFCFFL